MRLDYNNYYYERETEMINRHHGGPGNNNQDDEEVYKSEDDNYEKEDNEDYEKQEYIYGNRNDAEEEIKASYSGMLNESNRVDMKDFLNEEYDKKYDQ